jgi:hypothetical protein
MSAYGVCLLSACGMGKPNRDESQHARDISTPNQEQLPANDYVSVIHDKREDLTVSQEMGNFTFSSTYTPVYYQALLAARGSDSIDGFVKNFINANKHTAFFIFKIATSGDNQTDLLKKISANNNDYYKNLEYFSFKLQNDFSLVSGTDTVPCSLFHYERGYDAKPNATFVLSFDMDDFKDQQQQEDLVLSYQDKLFGLGRLNFRTPRQTINSLPSLLLMK